MWRYFLPNKNGPCPPRLHQGLNWLQSGLSWRTFSEEREDGSSSVAARTETRPDFKPTAMKEASAEKAMDTPGDLSGVDDVHHGHERGSTLDSS